MIENVPQFCDQLMLERSTREDVLVTGNLSVITEDRLTDLAEDDFLAPSVQAVDDWLAQEDGSEYNQISVLEANGFLASAQNAYGLLMTDAFLRRLNRQKQLQLLSKERGVIDDQLKLVGTVVDAPMLLQLSGQESSV